MSKLYVRVVKNKFGVSRFFRCGIEFLAAWSIVEVDDATAARLHEEQMLEVSETQPDDFEQADVAGDSASAVLGIGTSSDTPAAAPEPQVADNTVVDTAADVPATAAPEVNAVTPEPQVADGATADTAADAAADTPPIADAAPDDAATVKKGKK